MPDYVIDASAILAPLQNEPGADYVRACVERTSSIISAVNFAEVGYRFRSAGLHVGRKTAWKLNCYSWRSEP